MSMKVTITNPDGSVIYEALAEPDKLPMIKRVVHWAKPSVSRQAMDFIESAPGPVSIQQIADGIGVNVMTIKTYVERRLGKERPEMRCLHVAGWVGLKPGEWPRVRLVAPGGHLPDVERPVKPVGPRVRARKAEEAIVAQVGQHFRGLIK